MTHPLIAELLTRVPIVTDGAWGTQLHARGLASGAIPELWNLSHPGEVTAVARGYVEAGAEIVLTNTFGANRFRLGAAADRVVEINVAGVALSRQAANGETLIFASIGPSGRRLHNSGDEKEILAGFVEQVQAIATARPDGLVIETMVDVAEARLALRAACTTGLPVVASMVFDPDTGCTLSGTRVEDAAAPLVEAGADVVGANCGRGIAGMAAICARLRVAAGRPIWVKASAGLPTITDGKATYDFSPEEFAANAAALRISGASFIGGCCGTGPDAIAAIARRLKGK